VARKRNPTLTTQPPLREPTAPQDPAVVVVGGLVSVAGRGTGVPRVVVEVRTDFPDATLGSTITGTGGRFSVAVRPPQAAAQDHRPLRLRIVVLTAASPGRTREERILFESEERATVGRREMFLVELDPALLTEKGLERVVAETRPTAERRAEALKQADADRTQVAGAAEGLSVARVKDGVARRQAWHENVVAKVVDDLSLTTKRERDSGRFVEKDTDTVAVAARIQHTELSKLTAEAGPAGPGPGRAGARPRLVRHLTRLRLTQAQREKLGVGRTGGEVRVSQAQLEAVLGSRLQKPPIVERASTTTDPCRPPTRGEECLEPDTGNGGGTGGGNGNGGGNGGGTGGGAGRAPFDAGAAVADLMDTQTAPEDELQIALEPTLTPDQLPAAIGGVTLMPGPADVPAFHDFSELQLAFEPVWREALDDRVFDDLDAAYDRIVEEGLTQVDDSSTGIINIDSVIINLQGLLTAISAVPDDTAANVRISLVEYRALPASLRAKLDQIASNIETKRRELIDELLAPTEDGDGGGGGGGSILDGIIDTVTDVISDPVGAAEGVLGQVLGSLSWAVAAGSAVAYSQDAVRVLEQIKILQAQADRIVAHAKQLLIDRERNATYRPTDAIISSLEALRNGGYPFRYFAASPTQRSVNFGVMVTYRQIWTPVSYQVGDLVSTIPLGPREVRRYSKREVRKRRRSQRELEDHVSGSKYDTSETSRAETEILADARGKTSFAHTSEGTFTFGSDTGYGGSAKGTASFQSDAESHSQDVKKTMREAVVKASTERRLETKIEVDTEESFELEVTETGELMNSSDAITCTFLLYELQRRYRINEKLHRLQSVVLVAQEMPRARDLDADWLIRYDWILSRVLLDDSFRPALRYVATTLVSDRETLARMRQDLLDQQLLVEQLKEDLADRRSLAGLRYASLERQIERTAQAADSDGGIWDTVSGLVSGGGLIGGILGGGAEGEDNAAKIREAAARDAWERDRREEEDFRQRLLDAQSTLAMMRSAYTERLAAHLAELTQVERLSTHIYQNILYYMQAIWAHEPDDQRFLRLREVPVPTLQPDPSIHDYLVSTHPANFDDMVVARSGYAGAPSPPQPEDIPTRPLAEVADLSNPVGFMGNYMILAMYETNAITDFMMDPYVEFAAGEYGISDPDPAGNMSLDEFSDYVCCLKATLPKQRFDAAVPELRDRLRKLLQRQVRENEEIVVGTGNLYIEALPGTHSIIEQFKVAHRYIDIKAAQESLRATGLDNVRRAQRILAGDLDDPDVSSRYVFEGTTTPIVAPPVPPGGTGGTGGGDGGG
jgi:hypothetical protein